MAAKKKTAKKGCNCIALANKRLEEDNTRLSTSYFIFSGKTLPIIATEKIDASKRGKPVSITPAYCPFCGQEYE